ncbi:MAG: M50 family metallopeptidase [Minisyncoccota bacterium]
MSVVIFIIILVVLILAHEFGHFIVAKKLGIRVDEFGIGFPPRLWAKKWGETEYSLNAIPFGGFVKIFGEAVEDGASSTPEPRSFVAQSRYKQAMVIAAGIVFNLLFAWLVLALGLTFGLRSSASDLPKGATIQDVQVVVVGVLPKSPAALAHLAVGDTIIKLEAVGGTSVVPATTREVSDFIAAHTAQPIDVSYIHAGITNHAVIIPREHIVEGKAAIGISMDSVGVIRMNIVRALGYSAQMTASLTVQTAQGMGAFFWDIFTARADLSQVMGPVGLEGVVHDAKALGAGSLLLLTAIISINLAIINLIPFPALDGGRLLFIIIEGVKGSPIKPKIANTINAVGFFLLMALMVVVTYHDIAIRFFGR